MRFEDKFVVVTGGSSGIGESCVKAFLKEGAVVFVFDTMQPAFENKNLRFLECDVSQPHQVKEAVKQVCSQAPRIDHLISSAGVYLYARITDTSINDMQRIVSINLLGTMFVLHSILPIMEANKFGTVVLMGSDQTTIGKANSAVYGATKGALGQLAKSTAIDYASHNIRVNCVCPGTIDTPFVRAPITMFCKAKEISEGPIYAGLRDAQPIRRLGLPEEVAKLCLFLSSKDAEFISGALYPIDGGYTAGVDRVHIDRTGNN